MTETDVHDAEESPWWCGGIVYQIYPRSFADTDGDGIGDLDGIRSHVDHLAWLGVDAVWLSPVYRSPMADFGYDIADHCDVDPLFGDLATLDALIEECHRADLRVMLDWVPNHTSVQHPWFVESRASRDSPRRDWYVWRDGTDGGPPTNWLAAFGGPAWTWDESTDQWYLHLFLPEQPDLNWNEPDVVAAQHDVLRFWLARGVDGFRADVVHLIGKDDVLVDQPPHLAACDLVGVHDHPRTHHLLRGIRQVIDDAGPDRAIVGEVNLGSASLLAPYFGEGDQLHLVFDFALLRAPWDAEAWGSVLDDAARSFGDDHHCPAWVLSNHDTSRHISRYGGEEARGRVAVVVLCSLRGTPFLYAGEEIGLVDADIPVGGRVDPGGRDGCRAPLPWSSSPGHGWVGDPWLPWPPDPRRRNVETQRAEAESMLHLYRRVIAARRSSPALRRGSWRRIDAPRGVLGFERRSGEDRRIVLANFSETPVDIDLHATASVDLRRPPDIVVSSRTAAPTMWAGAVAALEAVIIDPRSPRLDGRARVPVDDGAHPPS
jgi:alpha-glucosidase